MGARARLAPIRQRLAVMSSRRISLSLEECESLSRLSIDSFCEGRLEKTFFCALTPNGEARAIQIRQNLLFAPRKRNSNPEFRLCLNVGLEFSDIRSGLGWRGTRQVWGSVETSCTDELERFLNRWSLHPGQLTLFWCWQSQFSWLFDEWRLDHLRLPRQRFHVSDFVSLADELLPRSVGSTDDDDKTEINLSQILNPNFHPETHKHGPICRFLQHELWSSSMSSRQKQKRWQKRSSQPSRFMLPSKSDLLWCVKYLNNNMKARQFSRSPPRKPSWYARKPEMTKAQAGNNNHDDEEKKKSSPLFLCHNKKKFVAWA